MRNISGNPPDLTLDIEIMNHQTPLEAVPDSLFHAKRESKEGFTITGGILNGFYSSKDHKGKIRIHPVLMETEAIRVFEQILYQAYVTAAGKRYSHKPLIHSSGVIKNGRGYLFVGASEAGKSTVAGLSSSFHIINDEITIADISGDIPMLHSTPFNGHYREKKAGCAPLSGIFILKKNNKHTIKPTGGGDALKLIASQIIPPVGLDQIMQSGDYLRQVDIALDLSRNIPLYNMFFAKNAGFWNEIERVTE